MFGKCELCGLKLMPIKIEKDIIDLCPDCDKEKIPEKYRNKTYLEISVMELKEALIERFEPIFKPVIKFINKTIDLLKYNQIHFYQMLSIFLLLWVFIYYLQAGITKNIIHDIKKENELLIKANKSLLESNEYLVNLNENLINRLYYDFNLSSPDTVNHKILNSIFNKEDSM